MEKKLEFDMETVGRSDRHCAKDCGLWGYQRGTLLFGNLVARGSCQNRATSSWIFGLGLGMVGLLDERYPYGSRGSIRITRW